MKMRLVLLLLFTHVSGCLSAAEWQWCVNVKGYVSSETRDNPEAFLWIPSDCKQVRAVVVGQHNMCEEPIFEHPAFRKTMAELGFAIVWITPGIDYPWDVSNGCQNYFDEMIKDLAEASGYSELRYAPIVPLGHSAMATFPWNFGAWNSNRTLAIISFCGDAPRTNLTGYGGDNLEWGRTRNIDGIPGLMIQGEYEWWEARVNPALAFRMMYPESCISFLCDAGHGHFDVSDEVVTYISLFLKKASEYRLPENMPLNKSCDLIKVDNKKGWLAERWHPDQQQREQSASYSEYEGDKHDAFWYFDKEIAEFTEKYYSTTINKKKSYIGFRHKGCTVEHKNTHAEFNLDFEPKEDGLTFHVLPLFTDSLRQTPTSDHSLRDNIKIDRICGPVEKINDTTFTVRFYRMGLYNAKRANDIWLQAYHKGDDQYKSVVQQVNIRLPYPIIEGKEQHILFDSIPNISTDTDSLKIYARSDSGLPVYYYVKAGPVEIKDEKILIKNIPPRAKYPLKVTVVAWQYGIKGKYKTANAVERSFYIEDKL